MSREKLHWVLPGLSKWCDDHYGCSSWSHWVCFHSCPLALSISLSLGQSSMGFPGSSDGKESACSAGDPGSIPGSGRSVGEGIGYPFQYSWASLAPQLVKNLSAMQETWVQSLGWEVPLEKEKGIHSSIRA